MRIPGSAGSMISSHAVCDHCERKLVPLDAETIAEDYLLESGWVCVKWTEGDEDGRVDETKDFCSFRCAGQWSLMQAEEPAEKTTRD